MRLQVCHEDIVRCSELVDPELVGRRPLFLWHEKFLTLVKHETRVVVLVFDLQDIGRHAEIAAPQSYNCVGLRPYMGVNRIVFIFCIRSNPSEKLIIS